MLRFRRDELSQQRPAPRSPRRRGPRRMAVRRVGRAVGARVRQPAAVLRVGRGRLGGVRLRVGPPLVARLLVPPVETAPPSAHLRRCDVPRSMADRCEQLPPPPPPPASPLVCRLCPHSPPVLLPPQPQPPRAPPGDACSSRLARCGSSCSICRGSSSRTRARRCGSCRPCT